MFVIVPQKVGGKECASWVIKSHKRPLEGALIARRLTHSPQCITKKALLIQLSPRYAGFPTSHRSYSIYLIPLKSPYSSRIRFGGDGYIPL